MEPGTLPWDAGVGRVTVREFESRYSHYCPRYCTQRAHSHIKWAERETDLSLSCMVTPPIVFISWKACLSVKRDGLALASAGKTTTWYNFAVHCSQFINHFQTNQITSTHTHTHQLTCYLCVDCSADTVRTVVGGFLKRSF